jgi:predicted lipid-binding transport protein (Tim44 family)
MSDGGVQFIDLIFLAMVAGFIALRLRSVLGRRTGNEPAPPPEPFRRPERVPPPARPTPTGAADGPSPEDTVVQLPSRRPQAPSAEAGAASGLAAIEVADRSFELDGFIAGSRWAYEIVVNAFAVGDTEAMRPLVSDEVMQNFTDALAARTAAEQTTETTIVAIKEVVVSAAALNGRIAEVTVRFVSEIVSVTRNASGNVVEGHPTAAREVTDIWTFARDTRSRDPNWTLVATATPNASAT